MVEASLESADINNREIVFAIRLRAQLNSGDGLLRHVKQRPALSYFDTVTLFGARCTGLYPMSKLSSNNMSGHCTFPTVGEIARRLNLPLHRVEYVIGARNIQPVGRAGNSRVFSEAAVDRIASECRRMDAERTGINNL